MTENISIIIGTAPRSEFIADFLERDNKGLLITGLQLLKVNERPLGRTLEGDPLMFETNVQGIFGAGDVRAGENRRDGAAVGKGSAAIVSNHKYLETI